MGLFGGGSPKVPVQPPPLPMPDLANPAFLAEQRRRAQGQAVRSGRASTILSGDDYGSETLGTR